MSIVTSEYDGFERLFSRRQIVDEDGFLDRYQVALSLLLTALVVGCSEEVSDLTMRLTKRLPSRKTTSS